MKVKRIVTNIGVSDPAAAARFYHDILGFEVLMDMGWIATYGSLQKMTLQMSFLSEGGSGAPVPDVSIELSTYVFNTAIRKMTDALRLAIVRKACRRPQRTKRS